MHRASAAVVETRAARCLDGWPVWFSLMACNSGSTASAAALRDPRPRRPRPSARAAVADPSARAAVADPRRRLAGRVGRQLIRLLLDRCDVRRASSSKRRSVFARRKLLVPVGQGRPGGPAAARVRRLSWLRRSSFTMSRSTKAALTCVIRSSSACSCATRKSLSV